MTRLSPSMDLRPTPRELRWFAQIDRHGPQSSEGLHAQTQPTHRCKDTSLRRLQALREAGFLRLPPQQNAIAKADFHPHVYDLTERGFDHLRRVQPLERKARPTGHWWHLFWVASVTGIVDIAAQARGYDYIPARRIFAIRGACPGIPTTLGTVVPDQIFALKTPRGFLCFALEVDRGTEPVRSNAARKSLQKSARQYGQVLRDRLYQPHYGVKSNMLVLWVFSSARRRDDFMTLMAGEAVGKSIAATVITDPFPRVAGLLTALQTFQTCGGTPSDPLFLARGQV